VAWLTGLGLDGEDCIEQGCEPWTSRRGVQMPGKTVHSVLVMDAAGAGEAEGAIDSLTWMPHGLGMKCSARSSGPLWNRGIVARAIELWWKYARAAPKRAQIDVGHFIPSLER
jgi:hypothetical protein